MRTLSFGVLGLAALQAAQAQCASNFTSANWDAAYAKAAAAVAKLSVSEKVDIATGRGIFTSNCTGSTYSVPAIGFPGFCLQDSALGVRNVEGNSAFPAGISAAATFDRSLIRQRAIAMAQEFRGKGIHAQLGPMVNLMRAPASGRGWEGFGGDPYLSGEAAYESVVGMQSQGVQGVIKHLINNEQEHSRMFSSSNVDDRTQHEVYLHPFLRAVQAGVVSAMCSYNQINGTYACSNSGLIGNNSILRRELGFRGYVMSDWLATHATTDANQGLDMDMPGGILSPYFGTPLKAAVGLGAVPEARVTEMATRILAAWYILGQDTNYPPLNLNANVQGDHARLIREIGAASHILLKNSGGVLPLRSPKALAVVGSDAGANPGGPNSCTDRACNKGVLAMGWGSGTANFPYLVTPLDAITSRIQTAGGNVTSSLSDTDLKAAAAAAAGKEYALVFISADSGETNTVEGNAADRNDLYAWHKGDDLVKAVAAVNNNTIVIVHTVGAIIVDAWIDNPNVTALVWANLPGQEAGNALVDVLWGDVNPSGRLPYTVAKQPSDYAAAVDYTSISLTPVQIPYVEGLNIDYRHFDKNNITPRFEFGKGLSYTTFAYADLSISGAIGSYTPPTGRGSSVDPSLHTKVYTFSFTLQNNGSRSGKEVPQLYLSPPASANTPPYLLKGFDSVALDAGTSTTVNFEVSRYDLSVWNVVTQRWEVARGTWGAVVGASSRDRRLTSTFTI